METTQEYQMKCCDIHQPYIVKPIDGYDFIIAF